jgi:hypothetical protein
MRKRDAFGAPFYVLESLKDGCAQRGEDLLIPNIQILTAGEHQGGTIRRRIKQVD